MDSICSNRVALSPFLLSPPFRSTIDPKAFDPTTFILVENCRNDKDEWRLQWPLRGLFQSGGSSKQRSYDLIQQFSNIKEPQI